MAGLFTWSTDAGSNTTVDGVNIAEGCSPAGINNAIRSVMALIRQTFASALETFLAGTAPLPLANGGTNATDAATALSNLGGLASTYRDLAVTEQTGAFALTDAMRGTMQRYTGAAAAVTINPNSTTAINTGGVIRIRNAHSSTGSLTLTRGSGVALRISGQTTDKNVTVGVAGDCFLVQEAQDVWVVSGTGIS